MALKALVSKAMVNQAVNQMANKDQVASQTLKVHLNAARVLNARYYNT
jgi:hypothetical protein